jgi:hypothetical protein
MSIVCTVVQIVGFWKEAMLLLTELLQNTKISGIQSRIIENLGL